MVYAYEGCYHEMGVADEIEAEITEGSPTRWQGVSRDPHRQNKWLLTDEVVKSQAELWMK
jgi:hypothetical protein